MVLGKDVSPAKLTKFDAISENGNILARAYRGNNGLFAKRALASDGR